MQLFASRVVTVFSGELGVSTLSNDHLGRRVDDKVAYHVTPNDLPLFVPQADM